MKKNKFVLLVFLFVQTSGLIMAQNRQYRKLSIEEMFGLADKNSRSIRTFDMAVQEAGQAVKVAKNAQLPSLDVSLSASYLGDGWLADRNFSDGENAPMPHFGNNFALEAVFPVCRSPIISSRCPLPIGTIESTALIPVCKGSLTGCR